MCLLNENVDVVVAVVVSVFAAWAGRDRWANQEGCFFLELFFFPGKKGSEKRLLTKEFHPNNFRIRVYIYIDIL
jgi:hypothetical protein